MGSIAISDMCMLTGRTAVTWIGSITSSAGTVTVVSGVGSSDAALTVRCLRGAVRVDCRTDSPEATSRTRGVLSGERGAGGTVGTLVVMLGPVVTGALELVITTAINAAATRLAATRRGTVITEPRVGCSRRASTRPSRPGAGSRLVISRTA